ncbi:hypothetical protein C8F04DRAFT_1072139 [Mycena alexandri]|uniref:ADF-H domain-containing protein n=1 Tax=Mycena alexandri TaxID=1745969 RepID=A0AAD6TBP5_9AGAR|nr:hypothetical protein C8F04DRAFT_1072139 [Mycena alexandri]
MAVNFADHAAVLVAYDAVLSKEANWLLLSYDSSIQPEVFELHGSGAEGLPELKSRIEDPLQIFVAFYREGNDGFILLNIIPESVSGVRRARALVHSRRIGGVFQAHLTSLTVDHLSNLTPKAIKNALASPDLIHVITAEPTTDELGMLSNSPTAASSPPPPSKGGSMFSLLRRKKKPELEQEFGAVEPFTLHHDPQEQDQDQHDTPPPPPPKDKGRRSVSVSHSSQQYEMAAPRLETPPRAPPQRPQPLPQLLTMHHRSNSEYTVVSRSSSEDIVVVQPDRVPAAPRSPAIKKRSATMPSKWNTEPPLDPAERARRRARLQRDREIEDRQAVEEEAQRQTQIKLQKEALLREQEEEEEMRRISLENELRRVTAQRRQREREEQEDEERKKRELEQKKRLDRARRIEEHRRLEEWRQGQAAQAEKTAQLAEQVRRKEEEERKKKILLASKKIKSTKAADDIDLITGWVTIQTGDSLVWRRRYFKFVGSTVFFYKSLKENESNQVVDEVNLRGQVRALREWNEGYEDLKAIPFSFAVEFNGEREPWSMFSDSEEEKVRFHSNDSFGCGLMV